MIGKVLRRGSTPYLFVSYKSDDVRLVRRVADHLIASGVDVWFAEYEILLAERDRFEDAIESGIERSTHGLAFTNDLYARSRHCTSELRGLLAVCGPDRVLDVRLSDDGALHAAFPELRASPYCRGLDVAAIVELVGRETRAQLRSVDDRDGPQPDRVRGKCMGLPYYLDARGWVLERAGGGMLEDGTTQGPVLRRGTGTSAIQVNVYAGHEASPHAWRPDPSADDRRLYEELLGFARRHVESLDAEVHGVHLLFHSGLSQMAVTYRMHRYWTRKVSIALTHPEAQLPGEFVFTFGTRASFLEYCYCAHAMDDLALSLEWGQKAVI